jgi:class 3 adenylate cyclase
MRYAFGSQARSRFVALALLGAVLMACAYFLYSSVDMKRGEVKGFDISGEWEFRNGPVPLGVGADAFPEKVVVPDPLPPRIKSVLAEEFWYRKQFILPEGVDLESKALFIGNIKGWHEVYWNGEFLGGGGELALGIYYLPKSFLQKKKVDLRVKVKRMNHLFPGIVHMENIVVGNLGDVQPRFNRFYFDTGVKPLLSAALKVALFFVFLGLFASVPRNREYFSFALFSLFSALSSSFYSRFFPGYSDQYLRQSLIFLFSTLSLSVVPMLAADLLRLAETKREAFRAYGFSLALIFLGAALMAKGRAAELFVYSLANTWMPLLTLVPVAGYSFFHAWRLDQVLKHRKVQISAFAVFSLIGLFALGSTMSAIFKFQLTQFEVFFDLLVNAGLAIALAMDFRFASLRSIRAGQVVPKWFSGILSTGAERAVLDLSLVVIAVDTVGYTKHLVSLPLRERENLHAAIREKMRLLSDEFSGQKISERGDGGIFAWDLPAQADKRHQVLATVIAAARFLSRSDNGVFFRAGISAGVVRGEMRSGDISFLGEALNIASRLEGLAEPGCALIDEALAIEVPGETEPECKEAELKGVAYRARPLKKTA